MGNFIISLFDNVGGIATDAISLGAGTDGCYLLDFSSSIKISAPDGPKDVVFSLNKIVTTNIGFVLVPIGTTTTIVTAITTITNALIHLQVSCCLNQGDGIVLALCTSNDSVSNILSISYFGNYLNLTKIGPCPVITTSLTVTKTASSVTVGNPVVFTIVITNSGVGDVSSIMVRDLVPTIPDITSYTVTSNNGTTSLSSANFVFAINPGLVQSDNTTIVITSNQVATVNSVGSYNNYVTVNSSSGTQVATATLTISS